MCSAISVRNSREGKDLGMPFWRILVEGISVARDRYPRNSSIITRNAIRVEVLIVIEGKEDKLEDPSITIVQTVPTDVANVHNVRIIPEVLVYEARYDVASCVV